MRRLCSMAVLLACWALAGCGPLSSGHAENADPARRFVFLGDSLTGGWYATTLARSYPTLVVNYWHATMVARLGAFEATTPAAFDSIAHMPGGATDVVVEVGTNDFATASVSSFRNAYGVLVAAVRDREPRARFVCLGLWQGSDATGATSQVNAFDGVISAACPGRFIALVPIFMDFRNHGPAQRQTFRGPADWFHPNDRGHAAIAQAIENG